MAANKLIPSIAHTIKSKLLKGNNVEVKEIREKYGDKIKSLNDKDIQKYIDKMNKNIVENNSNKRKQEVIMADKPVFNKDDVRDAVNDCLSGGKCDSFNKLSQNIDSNTKELGEIKSSVSDGCSKLSSIDDLKKKIDKQNDAINSLSMDKNTNNSNKEDKEDKGDISRLAIAALRTFSNIQNKESELSNRIKSLIDVNKSIKEVKDNKEDTSIKKNNEHVDDNSKVEQDKKDNFVTFDEALKHKELREHIIKKIINNSDMKNSLMDSLDMDRVKKSNEDKNDIEKDKDDVNKANDVINKAKDVIDKGNKVIKEVEKLKGINILKKLMHKI